MSVDVCVLVHVCVCELGALGCVGRVGLGIQVSLAMYVCLSR